MKDLDSQRPGRLLASLRLQETGTRESDLQLRPSLPHSLGRLSFGVRGLLDHQVYVKIEVRTGWSLFVGGVNSRTERRWNRACAPGELGELGFI